MRKRRTDRRKKGIREGNELRKEGIREGKKKGLKDGWTEGIKEGREASERRMFSEQKQEC